MLKPPRWNVSPALIAPEARSLWVGAAFVAPLWHNWGAKGWLLNSVGQPLAGANMTANGTEWRGTPYGLGLGNSNSAELRRLLQTGFSPIVTSDGAGTGDFTIMQLSNPTANALGTAQGALSQRVGTGALNQLQLSFDANNTFAYSAGSTMFGTYETAASAVAATGLMDGQPHVWVGTRKGTVISLYRDGVLAASASLTLRDILISGQDFCIGGIHHVATHGLAVGATIGISAGWNRALTNAEIQLLARDPFCMFRMADEWPGLWGSAVQTIARATAWLIKNRSQKPSGWRIVARAAKAGAWRIAARAAKASAWRIATRNAKASAWRLSGRAGKAAAWRIFTRAAKPAAWRIVARAARATAWSILNTLQAARAVAWRIAGRGTKPASWRVMARAARPAAWRIFSRAARAASWRIFIRTGKAAAWRISARRAIQTAWRNITRAAKALAWRLGPAATVGADVHLFAVAHPRQFNAGAHARHFYATAPKR